MITSSLAHYGDDLVEQDSPLLYRSYAAKMREVFGHVPTLGESFDGMITASRSYRAAERADLCRSLDRMGYPSDGRVFGTPQHLDLPSLMGISRTMGGQNGGALGGFVIPMGQRDVVIDKARVTKTILSFINVWETQFREYVCPVVFETSQANGQRYGGVVSTFGQTEVQLPAPSDGKTGRARFVNDRLLLVFQLTKDLWADSLSIGRWLYYVGLAEFRNALESAILNGVNPTVGPRGMITSNSTVQIARQTHGTITAQDVQGLYGSIADGNVENMVWVANRATIKVLNTLSVTTAGTTFPLVEYPKGWTPGTPNSFPTIYGRPLLTSPFSPATGQIGDLLAVDPSDYVMTWMRPKPTGGGLEFAMGVEADSGHRGFIGLPDGAMEARMSDQQLFSTDQMLMAFKVRAGGGFISVQTFRDASGNLVGPAAVLAV
jgi:HK97 family phage major capsid protein